jgi:chromate transporter
MSVLFDLFASFFRIGVVAFGGGYAMIPLISNEVVDVRGWLDMAEFVDVIAISQGTPGPIAINSATYVGFKVAGVVGSAVATFGVVLPPFIIMMILGRLFLRYKEVPVVQDMLTGIRPVVVALILSAALSVFSTSVTGVVPAIVAAAVVVAILVFEIDPILLLVLSGALGLVLYR